MKLTLKSADAINMTLVDNKNQNSNKIHGIQHRMGWPMDIKQGPSPH